MGTIEKELNELKDAVKKWWRAEAQYQIGPYTSAKETDREISEAARLKEIMLEKADAKFDTKELFKNVKQNEPNNIRVGVPVGPPIEAAPFNINGE